MTTGQLIFDSGLGLMGLTFLTAIVFLLKRPKYIPESAAYECAEPASVQKRRSNYSSERETVHQELPATQPISPTELVETGKLEGETAVFFHTSTLTENTSLLQAEKTDLLPPTEKIDL